MLVDLSLQLLIYLIPTLNGEPTPSDKAYDSTAFSVFKLVKHAASLARP